MIRTVFNAIGVVLLLGFYLALLLLAALRVGG
jgi:hypothetical protein